MNEVAMKPTDLAPTLEKIESIESRCLELPQIEMPVTHKFSDGVYYREIFMPKGTFVIGHQHKTRHFNVVLTGKASVLCDGKVMDIVAPMTFESDAGVRKILYIHEDMKWATIHPLSGLEDCGHDIEKLEDALRVKSQTFLKHEMEQLSKLSEGKS